MKKLLILTIIALNIAIVSGQKADLRDSRIDSINGKFLDLNRINQFQKTNNIAFRSGNMIKMRLDSLIAYDMKEYFTYDVYGRHIQVINYNMDSNGNWAANGKTNYSYDVNGNLILETWSRWNTDSSKWVLTEKQERAYDFNGNCISNLKYYQNSLFAWVLDRKEEITYNGKNEVSNWTELEDGWIKHKREIYFDEQGNDTLYFNTSWDSISNKWIQEYGKKTRYTYNVNNQITLRENCNWDSFANKWNSTPQSKSEYTYDGNGNANAVTVYNWDKINLDWTPVFKDEYTLNTSYSISETIIDNETIEDYGGFFNNMLSNIQCYSYNNSTDIFVLYGFYNYYYSTQNITDVNNKSSDIFKISTQNGQVILSNLSLGEQIRVYNMQGIAIVNQQADANEVSFSLPAHGFYLVNVGAQVMKVIY